jgi:hypothetical protein
MDIISLALSSEKSKSTVLCETKKKVDWRLQKCFAEEDHYTVWNDLVKATVIAKECTEDRYNISGI